MMAVLLYGAGLRLLECARLRVKDLDFAANQIVVRSGKGDRDRVTILPAVVRPALERQLARVRAHGGGWRAGAEAGGTCRGIPCRASQANTPGAGAVERGETTGLTRRSTRIGLGVLGIRLRARSGFGRYTELSKG